jgi:hypothetical protein
MSIQANKKSWNYFAARARPKVLLHRPECRRKPSEHRAAYWSQHWRWRCVILWLAFMPVIESKLLKYIYCQSYASAFELSIVLRHLLVSNPCYRLCGEGSAPRTWVWICPSVHTDEGDRSFQELVNPRLSYCLILMRSMTSNRQSLWGSNSLSVKPDTHPSLLTL